jgi:hypothetical protein
MTPKMLDAFISLSEEKGLTIPEVIAAYESVLNADLIFSETGNIDCDMFDKEIYNEVLELAYDSH